jgi:hypothetical protein
MAGAVTYLDRVAGRCWLPWTGANPSYMLGLICSPRGMFVATESPEELSHSVGGRVLA